MGAPGERYQTGPYSTVSDSLIWELNSQGIYSVQSLYATISFGGVKHIYTPVMWKLKVPSHIHIFYGC